MCRKNPNKHTRNYRISRNRIVNEFKFIIKTYNILD
jgi:hypothetical protein